MSSIPYVVKDADGKFTVRPAQGYVPTNQVGIVPSDIPVSEWRFIKAEEVTDAQGLPKWEISVDQVAKAALEAEEAKKVQDAAAYDSFIKDLYDKMYEVFRTRNTETATADFETWKDMKAAPAKYANLGLKVDHQIDDASGTELFSAGSALDTEAKVLSFATRKVEQAEEYAVYRIKKKQEYKDSL